MDRFELFHLGWDEEWEAKLADFPYVGEVGRISRVERGESDVRIESGQVRAQSDSQRSQSFLAPVTGDWVTVVSQGGNWMIEAILERRTELVRRDPGERETQQPLSANVDVVFLVHGFDRPFRAGKLERFLVLAWNAQATPVVVLTKSDLATPEMQTDLVDIVSAVAPDVEVVVASVEDRLSQQGQDQDEDPVGLARIEELLSPNRTGTLLGESGAGKSSLVNALMDVEVQSTQEVRRGDAKGRHTTITRDLLVLPSGGILIDTPGIRAVGLWDAQDALERVFSDILEAAEGCRFRDCAHDGEPSCAVREAVDAGQIDFRRLERFRAMAEELRESEQRLIERERANQSNRGGRRKRR